jgi:hypothetical protein
MFFFRKLSGNPLIHQNRTLSRDVFQLILKSPGCFDGKRKTEHQIPVLPERCGR